MSTMMTKRYNHTYPSLLGRSVLDDLFGSFFTDIPGHVKTTTQGYPVADIYRNDDGSTTIECALAGVSAEDEEAQVAVKRIVGSRNERGGWIEALDVYIDTRD